uniref:RanBD1 domain-containing protein n=1 Tax=Heliothis virescens TaxID=7102 RepID=A0A2A4JYW5_HELVI
MSVKRQATTELNHENWDQDDPADHEEMGSFKIAPKEMLEKRVIRTAKRRSQVTGDEPKKSVFSGFSGFNKAQPASFDFLSKLTNGSNDNNSSSSKADSSVTSSLFSNKPLASPSSGIFGTQSSATPTKSPFASPSTQTGSSSLFGVPSQNTTSPPSMFSTSKADSTVNDSPFKIQTVTSSTDNNTDSTKSFSAPVTSSKFDIPSPNSNVAKSLFSTTSNSTPFKIQPMPNTNAVQNTFGMTSKLELNSNNTEKKTEDAKNDKKMKYYSKLKGLNESVCDWIKKHVEQTPLCILSPIFKDYDKYLKEIQEEYKGSEDGEKKQDDKNSTSDTKVQFAYFASKPAATTELSNPSIFNVSPSSKSLFATQNSPTAATEKPGTFSFGIGSSTNTSSTITTSSAGFSFGAITSSTASAVTSSPFSFATTTSTTAANGSAAPFSFGIGKPFSFNSNVKQNTDTTEEANEDEDAPPKVEFTPVVEENSVYDKRCKVFVKKDGNFVDKGVGTLYIKKIEESGKHQLLVRANTNLGTILVNLILVSAIPTQRMGKNNVMLVCIPTPESKPPPTPILIRVKTSDEADELLETLNKYKT